MIPRFATFLSSARGFVATIAMMVVGHIAYAVTGFSDTTLLALNLALSDAAIVIAGIILVAGATDTKAIQTKLDEILRAIPQADDTLIGIERQGAV